MPELHFRECSNRRALVISRDDETRGVEGVTKIFFGVNAIFDDFVENRASTVEKFNIES